MFLITEKYDCQLKELKHDFYPNNDDVNLISVITYHLKPGHRRAFTQAVNKYHTAIKENNREAYYAFVWNVNGGSGLRVSLVLPYKNWAEMQGPDESLRTFMVRSSRQR